jgi:hypothetical protein
MGGMSGEVRGKSKPEVYGKYAKMCVESYDTFGDQNPDAKFKKKCKSLMVQDPVTGEWVLRFHWHT